MTQSGYTGFYVEQLPPEKSIIHFSKERTLINQLCLSWGVRAFYYAEEESLDDIIFDQINILKERGFLKKETWSSIPVPPCGTSPSNQYHQDHHG